MSLRGIQNRLPVILSNSSFNTSYADTGNSAFSVNAAGNFTYTGFDECVLVQTNSGTGETSIVLDVTGPGYISLHAYSNNVSNYSNVSITAKNETWSGNVATKSAGLSILSHIELDQANQQITITVANNTTSSDQLYFWMSRCLPGGTFPLQGDANVYISELKWYPNSLGPGNEYFHFGNTGPTILPWAANAVSTNSYFTSGRTIYIPSTWHNVNSASSAVNAREMNRFNYSSFEGVTLHCYNSVSGNDEYARQSGLSTYSWTLPNVSNTSMDIGKVRGADYCILEVKMMNYNDRTVSTAAAKYWNYTLVPEDLDGNIGGNCANLESQRLYDYEDTNVSGTTASGGNYTTYYCMDVENYAQWNGKFRQIIENNISTSTNTFNRVYEVNIVATHYSTREHILVPSTRSSTRITV